MLEPLDTESLAALLCDDDSDDDSHIGSAKSYLAKGDMAEGVFKLFEAFPLFQAQLYYDEGTYDDGITMKWHIGFKVSPFRRVRLEQDSDRWIRVYASGIRYNSYSMLGCPRNWQSLITWLWEYGLKRRIRRLNSNEQNAVLLPLYPHKLSALALNGGDYGCNDIRRAREWLEGDTDSVDMKVPEGLHDLLRPWDLFNPILRQDEKEAPYRDGKWRIELCEPLFRNLCLRPRDPIPNGMINIYVCGVLVESFNILQGPRNWQAILEWLWQYGNKRQTAKARQAASRPPSRDHSTSHRKQRRAEKPMLHRVLRQAGLKAQSGTSVKVKENVVHLANADVVMDDIRDEKALQCQALQISDMNRAGMPIRSRT